MVPTQDGEAERRGAGFNINMFKVFHVELSLVTKKVTLPYSLVGTTCQLQRTRRQQQQQQQQQQSGEI